MLPPWPWMKIATGAGPVRFFGTNIQNGTSSERGAAPRSHTWR